MSFPKDIECPITDCHYFIASANNNLPLFNDYINDALERLNNGEKLTFSFYTQYFPYSHDSKEFILIQVAEFYENDNFTKPLKLRNGMILLSPFEEDMVDKLSQFFCHDNIRIISYDIFIQFPILTKQSIKFDLSKVLDGNYTSLTGEDIYKEDDTTLEKYCRFQKCINKKRLKKNEKKDDNLLLFNEYHLIFYNQYRLRYKLYKIDDPFQNEINEEFYKSFVPMNAYISRALIISIQKYGLKNVERSTEEKIKSFCQTINIFGNFGPYAKRDFYLHLKHFKGVSTSMRHDYELWITMQNALLHFDVYKKVAKKRINKEKIEYVRYEADGMITKNGDFTALPKNKKTISKDDNDIDDDLY